MQVEFVISFFSLPCSGGHPIRSPEQPWPYCWERLLTNLWQTVCACSLVWYHWQLLDNSKGSDPVSQRLKINTTKPKATISQVISWRRIYLIHIHGNARPYCNCTISTGCASMPWFICIQTFFPPANGHSCSWYMPKHDTANVNLLVIFL